MKIGILTFHCAHNYGAVLQAYALSTYLKRCGYDVEIVDYRPFFVEYSHGILPIAKIIKLGLKEGAIFFLKILPFTILRGIRAYKFNKFINNLPLSIHYYNREKILDTYDVLICGSDQIWNKKITNGYDKYYTGQVNTKATYISYGASTELSLVKSDVCFFKKILNNFKHIGIREKELINYLRNLTDSEIVQVLDPVFLLKRQEWLDIAIKPSNKKPYLLVYQNKRSKFVIDAAYKLASQKGLEVYEITAEAQFFYKKNRKRTLSPYQFLGYFSEAEYVITTSFHGTAFSIIMGKPFKLFLFGESVDGRGLDLLKTLHIENATFSSFDMNIGESAPIIDSLRCKEMIDKSKNFLSNSLK